MTVNNKGLDKKYLIQKRVWKDVHYYGGWQLGQDYSWTYWEDLKGYDIIEKAEDAIGYLLEHKHQLKLEVQFRLVKNIDINKATLEIKELCEKLSI